MSRPSFEMDDSPYERPATPQALLHRAPMKPDPADASLTKPNKYIILLLAPLSVAGKVQIATLVAKQLSCPLFQGDSLHESSAKAALVGASRSEDGGKARYQRMWLSKMTRTGLLFPEASRPAGEAPASSGHGLSSTATSRRGSDSSISSMTSLDSSAALGSTALNIGNQFMSSGAPFVTSQYINKPILAISEDERRRKENPALMVLTHPELEQWHKDAIREAVREYGIGIIFVPLFKTDTEDDDEEEEEELPVLRPFDPRMISGFQSFDAYRAAAQADTKVKYGTGKKGNLEEQMVLNVDVEASTEDIIEQVVEGVTDVMSA
jgi:hypothetical protein